MSKPKSPAKRKSKTSDASVGSGYKVLARKYRPNSFEDLIGQDAMVRTLRNAFETGRIAQAYMLTGVRGVGKTTTARILARALNYERDGIEGPTMQLGEPGVHCAAIMESRHQDVLEIDAASHTGVDNIREIIDSVRYRPALARYKVYIIDEVHMLSKAAFNALLKTLEEPPEHIKFIFATTEVRKVPVTVLSRCQRFDLRRVDVALLQQHFGEIASAEGVDADQDAVTLIARAAEGSVRDGLSVLDQAIAHARGRITGDDVRTMLGLADRVRIFDLLEKVLSGDAGEALASLNALYGDGAEPVQILSDMAEAVHEVTRVVSAGADAADPTMSEAERERAAQLSERLDMPALARAWQMLLKGLGEARSAPRPLTAAEMVLVRMSYLADAPTPEDLAARLERGAGVPDSASASGSSSPGNGGARAVSSAATSTAMPEPGPGSVQALKAEPIQDPEITDSAELAQMPESFEEVVELVERHREVKLASALRDGIRLVSFAPPHIEVALAQDASPSLANELREFLSRETGRSWVVAVSDEEGEPTLAERREADREAEEARKRAEIEKLRGHPAVQAVLEQFPGAEITDIRPLSETQNDDEHN